MTISAQKFSEQRHSYTLQGSTYINPSISEEKVKNIYQVSFIYSYRISRFWELGTGFGVGKGNHITLKNYYFKKEEDEIRPLSINDSYIGYNTIRSRYYDFYGRAKLILYDNKISPFFLIDAGYSYSPFERGNFNLKGLFLTTSVGYDFQIFETGKISLIVGLDNQRIRYEKIESFYIINEPDDEIISIPGGKNYGLKEKFIHGLKISVGFTFNPYSIKN